ncbi:MAG: site-specific integrase [Proteobacteria bacterium]|nr:site-specific integrase [Pseudomonadota bacterium]
MSQFNKSISPLRQRMIEDMTLRRLSPKTQSGYLRAVKKLNLFLGRSPHTATAEDLRLFQLHMSEHDVSSTTINITITGLRFLFEVTLDDQSALKKMSPIYEPRKLPVVLSGDEVACLLDAATSLKYKAALAVAYSAGLRASEVTHLRVNDIDSERKIIHVVQGKGHKDRNALLSPELLKILRQWWHAAQAKGQMLKGGWLFPAIRNPVNPMSTRQLNRACHAAVKNAGINKRVSLHTLRHSFATHLLEQKVDIRIIQVLLGHRKLETTALYSQVATATLRDVKSPLDSLKLKPKKR